MQEDPIMSDEGRSSGGKAGQSNARTPTLCCFGEQRQPKGHGGSVSNGSTEALNNRIYSGPDERTIAHLEQHRA